MPRTSKSVLAITSPEFNGAGQETCFKLCWYPEGPMTSRRATSDRCLLFISQPVE